MNVIDTILTAINVLLAIASAFGARKSLKYYRKSKNLSIYTQINKSLIEIQKMLIKLPEALSASSQSLRGKKGLSLQNTLCGIGQELNNSLMEIGADIPVEYSDDLKNLQNDGKFELQKYINSFISGEAVKENCIDGNDYYLCQERLKEMQEYLKRKSSDVGEELK